jgi:hypothetical protein
MADYGDFVELGLEAFDRGIDKYHDVVYGGISGVPQWVRRRGSRRKRSSSVPGVIEERQTTTVEINPPRDEKRSSYDNGREREREVVKDHQMSGAMPPTNPSPNGRASLAVPRQPAPPQDQMEGSAAKYYRDSARDMGLQVDRLHPDDYHGRRRSRSHNPPPRSGSPSRERYRDRYEKDWERDSRSKKEKDYHLTVGLAGALAGGAIGKKLGHGDTIASVAGAAIGAVGAALAERQYEKQKERRRERSHSRDDRYDYYH